MSYGYIYDFLNGLFYPIFQITRFTNNNEHAFLHEFLVLPRIPNNIFLNFNFDSALQKFFFFFGNAYDIRSSDFLIKIFQDILSGNPWLQPKTTALFVSLTEVVSYHRPHIYGAGINLTYGPNFFVGNYKTIFFHLFNTSLTILNKFVFTLYL